MFTFTKIADYQTSIPAIDPSSKAQNAFSNVLSSLRNIFGKPENISTPQATFGNFSPPAIAGDRIVFTGSPSNPYRKDTKRYQKGIYVYENGALEVIVDTQTSVPQQDTTFGGFHTVLAMNAEAIAFVGVSQEGYPVPEYPQRPPDPHALDMGMIIPEKPYEPDLKDLGIYLYGNGEIQVVADANTLMPNTDLKFGFFGTPFLTGTDVIFWGESALPEGDHPKHHIPYRQPTHQPRMEGIYHWHKGALKVIADLETALPDPDEQVSKFVESVLAGKEAVYFGASVQKGNSNLMQFFRFDGSIAEIHHIHIRDFKRLGGFGGVAYNTVIYGRKILHSFQGSGRQAQIQLSLPADPDESELVANGLTPVPEGFGVFQEFLELAVDIDTLAFVSVSSDSSKKRQEGIYARLNGLPDPIMKVRDRLVTRSFMRQDLRGEIGNRLSQSLSRVVATGDALDNKVVNRLCLHPQGISAKAIAFLVEFSDRSQAIYRADCR